MKRIKFVYIYFLFLFYLIGGYFISVPFINRELYEKVYGYLGILSIPTLLFFILYGFIFMITDKKTRLFWELRLYYTFIFFIIGVYLYILFSVGIYFSNIKTFEITEEFFKTLINKSLFEYNIGYLPTYILYEFVNISLRLEKYPFYYFYYFLIGFEVFLVILTIFTPMRRSIKKSSIRRKREKQRAKIEAELMEQIKIKEELERIEALKIQKHKKIKEDIIKKKANDLEEIKNYKKTFRKKIDEKQIENKIKNQMEGIVLQKTVTIKED